MYPLGTTHKTNNITIDITKIDRSFIKAPNINHAFTDTWIEEQHKPVGPTSLYNCTKLELCINPIQR